MAAMSTQTGIERLAFSSRRTWNEGMLGSEAMGLTGLPAEL
jgi:hypothetical protein